jgi:carbamate kinase
MRLVMAIGGNAILPAKGEGDFASQRRRIGEVCRVLADLVEEGHELAVTHGNGPQVGNLLLQNEEARSLVPALPLDVLVAQTQAQIGYLIQQALRNELTVRGLRKGVATVVTQVLVDPDDEAFRNPTKPIGPYYRKEHEAMVKRAKGWTLIHDARGGWRRVVPSPRPLAIVEEAFIRRLMAADGGENVAIVTGGGGVPVVRRGGELVGVEAVIDKDLASAVLAEVLEADVLVLVTDVEKVALRFGTPRQQDLDRMTLAEARRYLEEGHFPPGSMGPKIEAAVRFLESGGARAVVASLETVRAALEGTAGTTLLR